MVALEPLARRDRVLRAGEHADAAMPEAQRVRASATVRLPSRRLTSGCGTKRSTRRNVRAIVAANATHTLTIWGTVILTYGRVGTDWRVALTGVNTPTG